MEYVYTNIAKIRKAIENMALSIRDRLDLRYGYMLYVAEFIADNGGKFNIYLQSYEAIPEDVKNYGIECGSYLRMWTTYTDHKTDRKSIGCCPLSMADCICDCMWDLEIIVQNFASDLGYLKLEEIKELQ